MAAICHEGIARFYAAASHFSGMQFGRYRVRDHTSDIQDGLHKNLESRL